MIFLKVTAAALIMSFVLSVLHLGNRKQALALGIAERAKTGVTEIGEDGTHGGIEACLSSLEEIKTLSPEVKNKPRRPGLASVERKFRLRRPVLWLP